MVIGSTSRRDMSVADTIIDMWELIDKVLQQQTLLENWMKGGFMNIAKSRYVMGRHSIGENQLPSGEREVSARLRVIRDPPSPTDSAQPVAFSLEQQSVCDTEPLRWFSALPPGALREAQQQFRRASEIACDIASLRSDLLVIMARLKDMKEDRTPENRENREKTTQLAEAIDNLSVK